MDRVKTTEDRFNEKAEEIFLNAETPLERMAASKYLGKLHDAMFPDSEGARRRKYIECVAGKIRELHSSETIGQPDLRDTVDDMLSDDYKKRFIAEFKQLKIRYKRLKKFCNRIEAAQKNKNIQEPKHDCPLELLREQQKYMGQYLYTLELRAEIEGIELP